MIWPLPVTSRLAIRKRLIRKEIGFRKEHTRNGCVGPAGYTWTIRGLIDVELFETIEGSQFGIKQNNCFEISVLRTI